MRSTSLFHRGLAAVATFVAAALLAAPVWANHQDDDADGVVDPPGRVGRISALRGSVDVSAEPGAAWDQAKINQPVTSGSSLFATPGSQAEVRIGSGAVRLDGNTQAVFSQLDDHGIAIDVAQGTVRARVRNLPTGDRFSLGADGVRAEAQGPGDFRVSYDPDRRAYTVRAIAGRLRVVTPATSLNLEQGQESIVEDGGENLHVRRLGEFDAFDAWAEARDRAHDQLASARYVSPETTGIEALDEHGRWAVVADYGPVWYPSVVVAGWAPYRYGHWAWVHPWGWTWIDDAPWGFAPFHYGRWALIGGSWGWVPGPYVHRPVYAPALVGYVGGRPRSGVSVSIGIGIGAPIGWFPLGPRELYVPPYRCSPRYGQSVNWAEAAPPGDRRASRQPLPAAPVYRYAQRPEALTVVSEDDFRSARRIGRERATLTQQQAAQLQPVAAAIPGPRARRDVPVAARGAAELPAATLPAPRGLPRGDADGPPRGDARARPLPMPRGLPDERGLPAARGLPDARSQDGRGREPRGADAPLPQARGPQPPPLAAPAPQLPQAVLPGAPARPERGAEQRAVIPERAIPMPRPRVGDRFERDDDPRAEHGGGRERRFVPPRPAAVQAERSAQPQVVPAPQVIPPPVAVPRTLPESAVIPPPRAVAVPQPAPMAPPAMQQPAPPPRQIHIPAAPQQPSQGPPAWAGRGGDRDGGGHGRGESNGRGPDGGRGESPRGPRVER